MTDDSTNPAADAASLPTITLKPRRALPFFGKHPWVFAGAIQHVAGAALIGGEVALRSHKGEFIARGLYNPDSNIRVRLYSWNEDEPLDGDFWAGRLEHAIALRERYIPLTEDNSARRLVYSEADGLSGLTVDQYSDYLLIQVTSAALAGRMDDIIGFLEQRIGPKGIWLRTEKGIREQEGLDAIDGLLAGEPPPRPLFIKENGVGYGVDVAEGQKTGYFLDQRENRAAVARYTKGHRVLDVFCYSGGFGLNALLHGEAAKVTAVDVSASAVTLARNNAELNDVADRYEFITSDAYKALEQLGSDGRQFETVIVDPPKMARHRKGLDRALRGYFSLNQLALRVLEPGGILVTCSCSGHVDHGLFTEMLASVAIDAGRSIQVLEARGAAPDHPTSVHCLENDYLKCYICRVS